MHPLDNAHEQEKDKNCKRRMLLPHPNPSGEGIAVCVVGVAAVYAPRLSLS
jgi:hypothetical protein